MKGQSLGPGATVAHQVYKTHTQTPPRPEPRDTVQVRAVAGGGERGAERRV